MPSRRQAVRRTQQKPRAKPVFELRDRLGNGGLADTQLLAAPENEPASTTQTRAFVAARRSIHIPFVA
jgi:hypothetical protein